MVDLGMPQLDGVQVIQGLRGWTQSPILVVSGRAGATDKVEALDAGADDYVTKPFSIDELLARIRALTRRGLQQDAQPVVAIADVEIDFTAKSVSRASRTGQARREPVRLTPTEWQVLEMLVRHAGMLVT